MKSFYANFRVHGLENCIFEKIDLEINNTEIEYGYIEKEANSDISIFHFYLTGEWYITHNEQPHEYRNMIMQICKPIIKSVILQFIEKGTSISSVKIDDPSLSIRNGDRFIGLASITITNLAYDIVKKEIQEPVISIADNIPSDGHMKLLSNLQEPDEVVKFEHLYQQLKNICGSQSKVKRIIQKKYKDKYTISCNNLNIDPEFQKNKTKYQDDFSYLRTLISHGNN